MECTEVITEPRRISRDIEARMYKFLQQRCEGDHARFVFLARRVRRSADGTASDEDWATTQCWIAAMPAAERTKQKLARAAAMDLKTAVSSIRAGVADGSPHFQAYLDTLEQHELDAIENQLSFFDWMAKALAERPAGVRFGADYLRDYAERHLSARVKALRAGA